ncbi:MAG TPA: glycosyltransferase 87 family protein [Acidimicrobiales bacterium]
MIAPSVVQRSPRVRLVPARSGGVVLVGAVVAGVAMSAVVATRRPILHSRWSLLGLLGVWSLFWLVGGAAAFRVSRRRAVVVVVAAGMAMRLAALGGPPLTSDDLFRYSWDGRVQAVGIDAYKQPPSSSALLRLREGWLWPNAAGCAAINRAPGCTRINRPDARTIYPPVAEAWFAGVYRVTGIGAHHKAWQVAGLLTEVATIGLLLAALRHWNRDPRWIALYALSPAPTLEIVNNAHVDGLAIVFVLAALVVIVGRDGRGAVWRDYAAGALVGVAAMVKLYPALLVVGLAGILWCEAGDSLHRGIRRLARAGGAAAAVAIVSYAPHVWSVGARVLGYLPGYLKEEHYQQGARFLIADALHVPHSLAGAVSALAVGAVLIWIIWRRPPIPIAVTALMGALLLAVSPVQPWYAVTLLAVATVAARPQWSAVVLAGYPYFFAVILDHPHTVGIGMVCYVAALAAVAAVAAVVAVVAGTRRVNNDLRYRWLPRSLTTP